MTKLNLISWEFRVVSNPIFLNVLAVAFFCSCNPLPRRYSAGSLTPNDQIDVCGNYAFRALHLPARSGNAVLLNLLAPLHLSFSSFLFVS